MKNNNNNNERIQTKLTATTKKRDQRYELRKITEQRQQKMW